MKDYDNEYAKNKCIKNELISYGLVALIIIGVLFIYGNETYKGKEVFAGVELEQRNFVMSIIMLKDSIVFELANEEENDWQSSSQYVSLKTTNLEKAEEMYKANGEKVLDFSHMKILFVAENDSLNSEYKKNLEYMYSEERFGENILVCELSGDLIDMTANAMDGSKALAVKIENILKASGKDKGRELYKVRNGMN